MPFPKKETNKIEQTVPDFTDVGGTEAAPSRDYLHTSELLGIAFIIVGAEIRKGQRYNTEYAIVEIKQDMDGETYKWKTSSQVIVDQLKKLQDKFPFRCTVKRLGDLHTLASAKEATA